MKTILVIATLVAFFAVSALAISGDATYFNPGLGSCGQTNTDADHIVAMSGQLMADTNKEKCGKSIKVTYQGKTTQVTVVDSCPGCKYNDIDLSPSAFKDLAPLDVGRIQVEWEWI